MLSACLSLSDVTQAEMFTHDVHCLTLAPVTFARVRPPGALPEAETPAVNVRATNNGAGVVFI